jgi:hypothetical protein
MAWTSFADGGEAEIFYTKVPGINRLGDSGPSTEAVTDIEACNLGNNRVATAVRDSGGHLKLVSWTALSDGTITPSDEKVATSLTQPAVVLPVSEIAMDSLSSTRLVTAIRDSQDRLRLITWSISDDGQTITRLFDSGTQAGAASEIRLNSWMATGSGLLTAVRTGGEILRLIAWELSPDGQIQRINDSGSLAGGVTLVALCQQTGNRYVTPVSTSSGYLKLISWRVG